MYNILEVEDKIKGLPDQALMKEAQFPSGDVPQFLIVSELQRRNEMRKSYSAMQEPTQTVPVAQQVVAEAGQGIVGMMGGNPMPMAAPMQAQTPMAAPMQSSMPAPMQPPMQPPVPQPQAPAGIVGMQTGRTVPTLRGASNQVAAVNAAIESLNSQGRDYTVYSQGELRRMGEDILGTDTVPSLESQGYKRFRPDLGQTYELESMDDGFFSYDPNNPFNRAKDAIASGVSMMTSPSGGTSVSRDIEAQQRAELGESATQAGERVAKYLREDEDLGILGGVLTGSYGLMQDYLSPYISGLKSGAMNLPTRMEGAIKDMFVGTPLNASTVPQGGSFDSGGMTAEELQSQLAALDQEQVPTNQVDTKANEIAINQDALLGSQTRGGFSVSGLPSNVSSRVLTEDLSKLVNKEMSLDGVMSNLMLQTSDLPEIPDGADFSTIAEARAKRGEAASTRMEELVQSIQSKAKSDALNMALLNIGAGIAGGDLAGGLEKAGSTAGQIASDARKSAQALELQSITMAEEAARSGEDVQIQEALSDLQRFSVEQGIAKDQRDYNLNIIKIKSDSDLGFQRLTSELAQSENISKRSVLGLIEKIIDEEADNAKLVGETYDAGARALQLYNPFAGIFGLSALSAKELENAQKQIGGSLSSTNINSVNLEDELQAFID